MLRGLTLWGDVYRIKQVKVIRTAKASGSKSQSTWGYCWRVGRKDSVHNSIHHEDHLVLTLW